MADVTRSPGLARGSGFLYAPRSTLTSPAALAIAAVDAAVLAWGLAMWSVNVLRSLLPVSLGLLLPWAGGCLMPSRQPITSETRGVVLGPCAGDYADVHAFRVDITEIAEKTQYLVGTSPATRCERHQLSEVEPLGGQLATHEPAVIIPTQRTTGWSSGFDCWIPLVYEAYRHVKPAVGLRLYRPGYELVLVNAADEAGSTTWKPALTIQAQMRALDLLFDLGAQSILVTLEPGSVAPAHRDALRFGASEYDRLALLVQQLRPSDMALAGELRGKAKILSERAAQ
jgi:hypothetical protein